MGVLLWIIIIGFIAGVIARLLMPGPNTPKGFVVTTVLGVAGALLATVLGEAFGPLSPRPGRRSYRRDHRRSDYFVCLESPRGIAGHSRPRSLSAFNLPI